MGNRVCQWIFDDDDDYDDDNDYDDDGFGKYENFS